VEVCLRAVVVDGEAAADVEVLHVAAHARHLDVDVRRLLDGVLDRDDARDLAADVKVQELQLVEPLGCRERSISCTSSGMLRPNLARSPAESAQRPMPLVASLARTPRLGLMPSRSDALSTMSSSSSRSSTISTVLEKRWAISAVSM
jgi:hypothetical protein